MLIYSRYINHTDHSIEIPASNYYTKLFNKVLTYMFGALPKSYLRAVELRLEKLTPVGFQS